MFLYLLRNIFSDIPLKSFQQADRIYMLEPWKTKTFLKFILALTAVDKIMFQPKYIDNFLIYPQNYMLWYSLEASWWGTSNECPQNMFKKNLSVHCCCIELWYHENTPLGLIRSPELLKIPRVHTNHGVRPSDMHPTKTRGIPKEEYLMIILEWFFLFLHKNVCCGYSLEAPHQGTFNEYLQCMFLWRIGENYPIIITKYSSSVSCLKT